jgi:hypothetical protein
MLDDDIICGACRKFWPMHGSEDSLTLLPSVGPTRAYMQEDMYNCGLFSYQHLVQKFMIFLMDFEQQINWLGCH